MFYFVRSGCAWRLLPRHFPPWKTVYHYLRAWRLDGLWERLLEALRIAVRLACGRNALPSAAVLDSHTVKTSEWGGPCGYDGGKKIKGRKHHILVDTMGLLLKAMGLPANVSDRDGGADLVEKAREEPPSIRHLFVDGGYQGKRAKWGREFIGLSVEVAPTMAATSLAQCPSQPAAPPASTERAARSSLASSPFAAADTRLCPRKVASINFAQPRLLRKTLCSPT